MNLQLLSIYTFRVHTEEMTVNKADNKKIDKESVDIKIITSVTQAVEGEDLKTFFIETTKIP